MATDIVPTLFGLTPEMYQRQQDALLEKQALQYAELDPMQRATYGIYRGAGQLGGAIGRALGGEDPELARISLRQSIAKQLDFNDPASFEQGFRTLQQAGDIQGAMMLMQTADEARKRQLERADQARKAEELRQAQLAQRIAQGAYQPGGEPAFYGKASGAALYDDEGNLMPGAGVTASSYDISRVAPELQRLGVEGQKVLLGAAKVNEETAKAAKLAAEAFSAEQKARFAGPAEQAEAKKKIAEAETAAVGAQFAERLQTAGLNKTNWDIANLQSQIRDRAAKLALDQQTTAATVAEKMSSISKNLTDLPADARKLINESATLAATAKQSADQFSSLASRIEAQGGNYGIASSASDFMKKIGGFQGGMTQLKQEYIRLRNTAAIKSLPPGPATDKDIQLALSGFPSETASAGDLAAFLRGMAKLQAIDSAVADAKTDWLSQNNGMLTRSSKTLKVGTVIAKPGESFNDVADRIVKEVNNTYVGAGPDARREALVNQIPTSSSSRQTQPNILKQADEILQRK